MVRTKQGKGKKETPKTEYENNTPVGIRGFYNAEAEKAEKGNTYFINIFIFYPLKVDKAGRNAI